MFKFNYVKYSSWDELVSSLYDGGQLNPKYPCTEYNVQVGNMRRGHMGVITDSYVYSCLDRSMSWNHHREITVLYYDNIGPFIVIQKKS